MATVKVIKIIKGTDVDVVTRIVDGDTGEPVSLSPYDEIKSIFTKDDGTKLTKTLSASGVTVVSACAGKLSTALTAAETDVFPVGEEQSFEVELIQNNLTPSQKTRVVQFLQALTILDRV